MECNRLRTGINQFFFFIKKFRCITSKSNFFFFKFSVPRTPCQIFPVVKFLNELRMSCDVKFQLSCESRPLSNFMWLSCELSCKNLTQLQNSAIIYIYISPFIITQILKQFKSAVISNFCELQNFKLVEL